MGIKLKRPKLTFSRFGQLVFTFKEISKIAFQIKPKYLITLFILSAMWGFLAFPGFYLDKLILDKIVENIGNPDWRSVVDIIVLFIALRLLLELTRDFMSRAMNYFRKVIARYLNAELDSSIGRKLSEIDMVTLEDPSFKDKFTKIERESARRAWDMMSPISDIPNFLTGFTTSIVVLYLIHPLVAVGVLIASVPQLLVDSKFISKDYVLSSELAPLYRMWGWLRSYLVKNRNYMELKILNLPKYLDKRLKKIRFEAIDRRIELSKKRQVSNFVGSIPLVTLELILSVYLVVLVLTVEITIGTFQFYLRTLRSAQQNLSGLVKSFLSVYENYIYVADYVWFMDIEPTVENDNGILELGVKSYPIEFRNVWFKYKDGSPWILKDINFSIHPKENIAIVGLNGSGKSTLIKLLARFYDPQRGTVLVDSQDMKDLNLKKWRSELSVLFQEFETYPFSAKESIGYGDVSRLSKLAEIKEAAKKTGMHDFIEDLPLGYNNPLDPVFEKGVRPSIGQLQRIGISRMLFRMNANVIVMDEPTSSVDPEAEEKVFRELIKEAKDKILIFVTQRFSTVRLADRIFVVDKGKIIEQGSHKELMKVDGKYASLFNLQADAYK